MRYSRKRDIRKTKKNKKGGSGPFRRGLQTLGRTVRRGGPPRVPSRGPQRGLPREPRREPQRGPQRRPPRFIDPNEKIKKVTNSIDMFTSTKKRYNTLTLPRNRRTVYDPSFTLANAASIATIPSKGSKKLNIINLYGIILENYAEDCHGCLNVKKGELVKIIFEYKTTDKIKVERERDSRSGKVPKNIVDIIYP